MVKKRNDVLVSVLMVVLAVAMLAWPSVTGREQSITTRRGREISVVLALDDSSDPNAAGLTGQLNFDAKLFSSPRIAVGPGAPGFRAAFAATKAEKWAGCFAAASERAPCILLEGQKGPIPCAILLPALLRASPDLPRELHERAEALAAETAKALEAFREHARNPASAPRERVLALWERRRFLPQWGRMLWDRLRALGQTAWMRDALADPWTSESDRASLRQWLADSE